MKTRELNKINIVIPVVASILISLLLTYLALSKRFEVSVNFPSGLLDWFAIIGGSILVSIAILGLNGLIKVIRS